MFFLANKLFYSQCWRYEQPACKKVKYPEACLGVEDSTFIHKSHNVSILLYYIVTPTKYRRFAINDEVEGSIRQICEGIEMRWDWIKFIEVGADGDHVHYLVQSTPEHSPTTEKEYNSQANICRTSKCEEEAMGRRILERRLFCFDCRKIHK